MIKRLIGPILMIAFGAALLVGPAQSPTIDVGNTTPCTTLPPQAIVVDPCTSTTTSEPCGVVGIVSPCSTTTTEPVTTTIGCGLTQGVVIVDPCDTTTTELVTTTVQGCVVAPPGSGVANPCPSTSTTEPPLGTDVEQTTTPSDVSGNDASQGGSSDGSLPRTGSNDGPLTVAGVSLIVLGAGLALAGRRHHLNAQR